MKKIVIYESFFGNTKKIAQKISESLGAKLIEVKEAKKEDIEEADLLVVGSPTRAFRPTEGTVKFLSSLGSNDLKGINVASFDTRINPGELKSSIARGLLGALTSTFGYAAEPIAKQLVKKGGKLIAAPEGFYVKDSEGPLAEKELERAEIFANKLRRQ
jgi:flavodoxin